MRAVITFHAIDHQPGPLSFPPAKLDALLCALAEADVPVLDLATLLAPAAPRGVALTFDDGMASLHEGALPILRAHRAPAHVFLVTGRVGKDNRWPGQPVSAKSYPMLDWRQIEALHAAGILFEGHSANHPDLRLLGSEAIAEELAAADEVIEARLARRPAYFAYPYGYHNAHVRAVTRERYAACFTTELDYLDSALSHDAIPRLDSHYLRSRRIVRALPGRAGYSYIALRRLIRRLQGRT